MTDWQDKAWGRTRRVVDSEFYQRHELHVHKGGYCSVHYHEDRANRFIVQSGEIVVAVFYAWNETRSIVREGDVFDVPSRVVHQFLVRESGKVFEEYWPDRGGNTVRTDDIVRLKIGGRLPPEVVAEHHDFQEV